MNAFFDTHGLIKFFALLQTPIECGIILILFKFVLFEGYLSTMVWLRFTVMDSGELCVIDHFDETMPLLYAGSLDTTQYDYIIIMIGKCEPELHVLIISLCTNLFYCCSVGTADQPIWLSNAQCGTIQPCLGNCTSCPKSQTCTHSQDVTVECTYEGNLAVCMKIFN